MSPCSIAVSTAPLSSLSLQCSVEAFDKSWSRFLFKWLTNKMHTSETVSERNLKHQDSGEIEIATPVRLATDPLHQPWLSPNAMQPHHLWVQVQILLTSVLKSCVKPEIRTLVADVVTSTVFKWHFQQSGVDIPVNCSGKKRRQILIEGRLWYF